MLMLSLPSIDVYNWIMNEADIQVLASIKRAEIEDESTDRGTLEGGSDRYWKYLEDWSDSWQRLLDGGLIEGDANGYALTAAGRPHAEKYYAQRPDHFWYYYQYYYPAAQASKAHSELCERVFGKDLTQDGQADMRSIDDLIKYMGITENDRVLDLGCGAGGIAEYISDVTGAHVTGLDYAATATDTASARTASKRDRLTFVVGDMNALQFDEQSFDKIISIDTIYWVANIDDAIDSMIALLKPGGRLALFIAHTPQIEDEIGALEPNNTWVARSFQTKKLAYDVHDYSESFQSFWPKLREVVLDLKNDFIAEGNEVIFDSFMLDADEDYIPASEAGKLRRYLYIV
jgi:ubiquinone/menaquinone biosynthesis C-methylase UbiE